MSGEVGLLDDERGSTSRLVRAAGKLLGAGGLGRAALVGGLAVTARLATVHRVTNDVDTVVDDQAWGTLALTSVADNPEGERIDIDGVKVDVMATSPLPTDETELPDDDHDRLFVLGHRWALESASALKVRSVDQRQQVTAEAELNVATSPALLACKLHAITDRRAARRGKQESDARDIVGLTQLLIAAAESDAYSDAPFDLAVLVQREVRHWLVDNATRTAGLINLGAGAGDPSVDPADLAAIGRLFTE